MPVIDDDLDDVPLQLQPPRPSKPPIPKTESVGAEAAQSLPGGGHPTSTSAVHRQSLLIPVQSLYSWKPDQEHIDKVLGCGRPE